MPGYERRMLYLISLHDIFLKYLLILQGKDELSLQPRFDLRFVILAKRLRRIWGISAHLEG